MRRIEIFRKDKSTAMKDIENSCKIALVQAEPVMFDKSASLKKTLQWIAEAAAQKPDLIVFPELFIPGYPVGMNFGFCIGKRSEDGRKDWKRYYDASVVSGETEFQQLAKAAQETGAYISLGFSERDAVNGTLYNSNVIFEPDGSYKVHRKLKPTGSERVVWGDADKGYFPVTTTPWGPIGSLICWESYMPLARVALYQKGITIYISPNTNDNPEWQATIQHIAIEGKCYFVNADMIGVNYLRCNLRDFPDKVIHDPDFLYLLAVHFLDLAILRFIWTKSMRKKKLPFLKK